MKRTIVLHSGLSPEAAAEALRRSIDEERRKLFSLSGYKGEQPIVGVVTGNSLRLQKRRFWRNDFAPQFYGLIAPEAGGTRIEGYFDLSEWVRTFMWVWLVGAASIGIPVFIFILVHFLHGVRTENDWVGLVVPPALLVWGFVLPTFGRLLGKPEETFIVQYLQKVLYARIDPSL